MNKRKSLITALILIFIAICVGVCYWWQQTGGIRINNPIVASQAPSADDELLPTLWTKAMWQENHEINEDYVGTVRFASGMIEEPVVQASNNSYYLYVDWKTDKYDNLGTVFMDSYVSHLDSDEGARDHNVTLYGHYAYPSVDPTSTARFSLLNDLKEEENYEANKTIYFLLADEIREYVIADVFYVTLIAEDGAWKYTPEDMQYYLGNFTSAYMKLFKEQIALNRFYETGVEYDENDYLLTLQTCVFNQRQLRLIVIAKEVNRYPLP